MTGHGADNQSSRFVYLSGFVSDSNASVFGSETQRIALSSHKSFHSPSVFGFLLFFFFNFKHTQVSIRFNGGLGDETRHPQVPSWIVDWGAVTWVQVRVQSIINHTT